MKGVIFNQLQKLVTETQGLEAWEQVLTGAKQDGIYVSAETYADKDFFALVSAVSTATGTPVAELVQSFGRFIFADLARMYPSFLQPGMTAKTFLLTVDRVIHVEVRKLHPDAGLPSFAYEDPSPEQLVMIYRSPRQLCDLAVGLINGVAQHFHERIELAHPQCCKHGAESCRLELRFFSTA